MCGDIVEFLIIGRDLVQKEADEKQPGNTNKLQERINVIANHHPDGLKALETTVNALYQVALVNRHDDRKTAPKPLKRGKKTRVAEDLKNGVYTAVKPSSAPSKPNDNRG